MSDTDVPMTKVLLERLARKPAPWVARGNCIDSDVDMITATKSEMKKTCGPCNVSDECALSADDGDPVRAGARGGEWRSTRTEQQP